MWSKTSDGRVGVEGDILIEGKRSLDRDSEGTWYGDGVGVELLQVDDIAFVSLYQWSGDVDCVGGPEAGGGYGKSWKIYLVIKVYLFNCEWKSWTIKYKWLKKCDLREVWMIWLLRPFKSFRIVGWVALAQYVESPRTNPGSSLNSARFINKLVIWKPPNSQNINSSLRLHTVVLS